MSILLKLIGILVSAAGILWTWAVLSTSGPSTNSLAIAATVLVAVPGISTVIGGLLIIAVAVALDYLHDIARATQRTEDLLDRQFNPRA